MKTSSPAQNSRGHDIDRRRFRRFLAQPVGIHVHIGKKTIPGKLVNESIGGLALTIHDATALIVGQEIQAIVRNAACTAYVRSVRRRLDGKYRIGVSWEKSSNRTLNAVADFLSHDNLFLVCEVLCDDAEPVQLVRLWDGA